MSVVFAELYSFVGVFTASSTLRNIYPISAVFGFSGAYITTTSEYILCCISLFIALLIAGAILKFDQVFRSK